MPGKAKAAFLAHAVGGDHHHVVLGGAHLGRVLPGVGAHGPVRGDAQHLRALEFHHAARLGEAAVITDVHAQPGVRRGEHGERAVTERAKTVDAEVGQMDLAVRAQYAFRTDDRGGVVDPLSIALEHPDHDRATDSLCGGGDLFGARTRNGFGQRPGFLAARETVTGKRAFGKDDELGPGARRRFQVR